MKNSGITAVLIIAAVATWASAAVRGREAATTRPAAYAPVEWIVELDRSYDNPFDPTEIAVDATFTGPQGQRIVLPGFWYQEFRRDAGADRRDRRTAVGNPHWRVRFCAPVAGQWQMIVTAKDRAGSSTSEPLSFTVAPSKDHGFVRRSPGSSRYLQFDDGSPYFIVGPNICWAGSLAQHEMYLSRLGEAGGNFARFWMTRPGIPMETKAAGLGRYDLIACDYYDHLFQTAAKNNIRCMLAIQTYGDLIDGGHFGEGNWGSNPYNAANGGPATRPADFSTHPLAREIYKRRLRYLIGRYSAYTSLAFWEFFNEQDLTKGAVTPQWVGEMARYLKANDPYRHLVTTSFAGVGPGEVWSLPEIDLTQRHMYGDEGPIPGIAGVLSQSTRSHDVYRKPHLIGEIGISWRGPDTKFDPNGVGTELHNTLWTGAFSGAAGGACSWWWDNYIHPKNIYGQYTALAKFAATVDWPRENLEPVRVGMPVYAKVKDETFRDMTLTPTLSWGQSANAPVIVEADGTSTGAVPKFLYGPAKRDMRKKLSIRAQFPRAAKLIVHVAMVSVESTLSVSIDGRKAADFAFNAKPGSPDIENTKLTNNIYQAIFNKDRTIDVPAGLHTISLDNTSGDWMSIDSIRITNFVSSRYTGLKVLALTGNETLAWLLDPHSTCTNDLAGKRPQVVAGAVMELPVRQNAAHIVEWWDTRKGQIVQREEIIPRNGLLRIEIPSFQRDIALRARVAN